MAPTSSIVDGVTTTSAHTIPPACFSASPEKHGLCRIGPKDLDEPTLLLAVINTLTFRFQQLSVSEEPAPDHCPTPTAEDSVHSETPTGPTNFMMVKNSVRRKLFIKAQSDRIEKYTKRVKVSLQKAIRKCSDKVKKRKPAGGAPSGSPAGSPPPSERSFTKEAEELDVGPIIQHLGGLSIADAEVTGGPKFHGMFTVEVWRSLAAVGPEIVRPSSSFPSSTASVAMAPMEVDTAQVRDEDFDWQEPLRPMSPVPTAVRQSFTQSPFPEAPSSTSPAVVGQTGADSGIEFMDEDVPSPESHRLMSSVTTLQDPDSATHPSDATLVPESPQSPLEQHMEPKSRSVTEPNDIAMAEEERGSSDEEFVQQVKTEGSYMEVDPTYTADPSLDSNESMVLPKALSPDVAVDATGLQSGNPPDTPAGSSVIRIQPTPSSPDIDAGPISPAARDTVPITTSNTVTVRQENSANGAMRPESPLEGDPTRELDASARQAAPTEQTLPASIPVPTAEPTSTPPSVPIHPVNGPSTDSSNKQGPAPISHAGRVHQVQAKMREAKSASKVVRSPTNDEASEEAEVDDFLAKYNLGRHRRPVKLLPPPPAPISKSKPRQSKGDASRSLMSDLMAGFTRSIKPESSRKQAPVAAPAQHPAAPNVPAHISAAVHSRQPLPHIVAGRQAGLPSTPPNHTGRRPEVVASPGSVIPFCRAPSSAPKDGIAKGPEANHSTSSNGSSDATMDGVVNGQRTVKGSRRVARAMARTGLTWQIIQQNAQDSQSAFDRDHNEHSSASIPITGAALYQEAVRSGAWHAAQPPPPPDAIPFIRATLDDDDDDDLEKALDRALS
ncbi:hypothetical protein FRC05_005831 [Tulasnella sp. 425]|nr:hypothetical protein FRC05_005831 [Tulasnella sp. 425]